MRLAGLEPARLAPTDFKSVVSAIPPQPHGRIIAHNPADDNVRGPFHAKIFTETAGSSRRNRFITAMSRFGTICRPVCGCSIIEENV